ncbi:MAG: hypothetical protein Q8876_09550, partial [Bacillota bacterium]|nr:hypothetical protein [Bacillota bacterium]
MNKSFKKIFSILLLFVMLIQISFSSSFAESGISGNNLTSQTITSSVNLSVYNSYNCNEDIPTLNNTDFINFFNTNFKKYIDTDTIKMDDYNTVPPYSHIDISSFFTDRKKSCYFCCQGSENIPGLNTPRFDFTFFDDNDIPFYSRYYKFSNSKEYCSAFYSSSRKGISAFFNRKLGETAP